jgi:two-component system, sensor histidine kinase and response regulator
MTDTDRLAADQSAKTPEVSSPPLTKSLLLQYTSYVALVIVLAAGALAHLGYQFARGTLHDEIHNRLRLIASERSASLEAYASRQLDRVALVVSRTRLRQLVQQRAEKLADAGGGTSGGLSEGKAGERSSGGESEEPLDDSDDGRLRIVEEEISREAGIILRDALLSTPDFKMLWITDLQGNAIAAASPESLPYDFRDNPTYWEGIKRPHLGRPRQLGEEMLAYVAAPVRSDLEEVVGVLVVLLDVEPLSRLLTYEVGLQRTGSILVGTRVGEQIEYLLPTNSDTRYAVPVSRAGPMVEALEGRSGSRVSTYDGVRVLAAFQPVEYQPAGYRAWGLVAKLNLAEAYAPVSQLRRVMIALQVVLVLAGIATSFLLARRLTRRVMDLANSAAQIAAGNLTVRVPDESRDELGLLGATFNHMAEQLAAAHRYLEERVSERTEELIQSHQELRQQTRILRSVLDSMADGVIVADQKGVFTLWNPAAERIVGVGPRDVETKDWPEVYGCFQADGVTPCPPEEIPLARAIRGESIDAAELFLRNPDVPEGRWINVNARPLANEQDELRGGVVVVRDVTASKRAEEQLRSRDAKSRAILATAHEAFVAIDSKSHIVEWNEQAEVTFGWSREEVLGKSFPELMLPERHREAHYRGLEHFFQSGKASFLNQRLEMLFVHRDGREFPVEITITGIQQEDSPMLCAFLHDITEQKQARRELQRAKDSAEAASQAKSTFLANMSHEIRTPMNAIIGMTELVLDTKLTRLQREYLTIVQESAESLLAVINDILDFSKIEAGRLELDHAVFDLREVLGDTMKSMALRAHDKGLELAYHVDEQVPALLVGDRQRLRQVIVNLAGNAIKFTDQGEVVVDVTLDQWDSEEVELHFRVRDTGIGIPAEQCSRIFEAFEQADESPARRFSGTGLGLAISARLSELMNGRVWVESEVGEGSTFHVLARFKLPAETRQAEAEAARKPEVFRGLRVLIVDDNLTAGSILSEMLRSWNVETKHVTNPREGEQVLRDSAARTPLFDVLLIDADLPDDQSLVLTRSTLENVPSARILVMLTSHDPLPKIANFEQLGVTHFVKKPIKPSELYNALADLVGLERIGGEQPKEVEPTVDQTTRPLRILLAEDSAVNQKLAIALLHPRGHEVMVANNGREALARLADHDFDLVLMDVQMPEMDGLTATRQIRQREAGSGRHVPIIAMTAHAMKGDRERCLAAGMDGYVSKPIRASELHAAIAELLPSSNGDELNQPDTEGIVQHANKPHANKPHANKPHGNKPHANEPLENEPLENEPSGEPAKESPTREPREGSDDFPGDRGTAETNESLFDWQEAMRRTELPESALRELAEIFLEEVPRQLAEASKAVADENRESLYRSAHSIRGSAALFVAPATADIAAELERLAKQGNMTDASELCHRLDQSCRQLSEALAEYLKVPHSPRTSTSKEDDYDGFGG